MGKRVQPWSETKTDNPVELPDDLVDKNVRLLNPLGAPDLYFELYDNAAKRVTITDPNTGESENYELVANINNSETSSHFKVIRNPETGHHVLIGKGMDLVGRNEGAGRFGGVYKDMLQHDDAENYGCITGQVLDGEKAYLDLLEDSNVKSIEIIGYSLGSLPASYLASVYGAQITNFADLGVPHTGSEAHLKSQRAMSNNFNVCSKGYFPGAYGEFKNNLDKNTVGLRLRADVMAGNFLGNLTGKVGERFGTQIMLDKDDLNIAGAGHVPQVYADTAKEVHDAPETETVEKLEVDTWKPFN
ncbi:MAG: hypothetical protein AAF204_02165 [Pseudomonadota bacterium]